MLDEGQQLEYIDSVDNETLAAVGKYSCVSITVTLVNGQMAGVPWAVVKYENGAPDRLLNLAHVLDVGLVK